MADETTQAAAKKAAGAAPAPGGKIVFRCPNGHRIIARAETAGQRGRCSKCGTPVEIPVAPGADGLHAAADAPPAAPHATSPAIREEAPAIAGQAPGGPDRVAEAESAPPAGQNPAESGSSPDLFAGIALDGEGHGSGFVAAESPARMPEDFVPNPNATLVARLFEQRDHNGIVEIHITGGSVILPEFFDPRWSTGALGLFASQAADGTVTLTAVAWDAIQKIVVRKVEGLPDGMFE